MWNYASNGLKLAFLPYTIAKAVGEFENKPDYAFTEVPLPYDISISAKGAGTRDVEYSVIPARSNTPVPPAALAALEKERAIEDLRRAVADRQHGMGGEALMRIAVMRSGIISVGITAHTARSWCPALPSFRPSEQGPS